jgi:CRISPR-associated protein Csb2
MVDFETAFEKINGARPFPWQRALYERFVSDQEDNVPGRCELPTGLGKTAVVDKSVVAFRLLTSDGRRFRAFDTIRRAREVAGMLRGCVAKIARHHRWADEEINVFIHGKMPAGDAPAQGDVSPDRFAYLPLPTINQALGCRVESIRRVLLAAPLHCGRRIAWARRLLAGNLLCDDRGTPAALLQLLPRDDGVLRQYLTPCDTWTTVTPVILPRHDGSRLSQAGNLLRLAFEQAGYPPELIAKCDIQWRGVGFLPGVDLATRYLPPQNLCHKPRYHVRVRFPHPVPGPIAVGAGRFRGFGLFVATAPGTVPTG